MRLRRLAHAQHALNAVLAKNTSNTNNKLIFSALKSPTQIGFDVVMNLKPKISWLGLFLREEMEGGKKDEIMKMDPIVSGSNTDPDP